MRHCELAKRGEIGIMPDPLDLLGMLVFTIAGIIAFRSGKRKSNPAHLVIGMTLMVYTYFVSSGFALWGTGAGLCYLLHRFRA